MSSKQKTDREPRRLPPGAVPIRLNDPHLFPDIHVIKKHSKVPQPHGTIVLATFDWGKDAMELLFEEGAGRTPPPKRAEAEKMGMNCLFLVGMTG